MGRQPTLSLHSIIFQSSIGLIYLYIYLYIYIYLSIYLGGIRYRVLKTESPHKDAHTALGRVKKIFRQVFAGETDLDSPNNSNSSSSNSTASNSNIASLSSNSNSGNTPSPLLKKNRKQHTYLELLVRFYLSTYLSIFLSIDISIYIYIISFIYLYMMIPF